jgi:putative endonuclease
MQKFYVYVLRSITDETKTYVGFTEDLGRRIKQHNSRTETYSKRYAPWGLVAHVAFGSKVKAKRFEKYLKTGSGKAFIRKHLL